MSLSLIYYLGVHSELDHARCEVGVAGEDRIDGSGFIRESGGSKDLVGLAEHACRGHTQGRCVCVWGEGSEKDIRRTGGGDERELV